MSLYTRNVIRSVVYTSRIRQFFYICDGCLENIIWMILFFGINLLIEYSEKL